MGATLSADTPFQHLKATVLKPKVIMAFMKFIKHCLLVRTCGIKLGGGTFHLCKGCLIS